MNQSSALTVHERLPLKIVLASIIGAWLCYFLLVTLRGNVMGIDMQAELLWRRSLVCAAGAAVTVALWLILRLFESRALWIKIGVALLAALPASVLIAQINQAVFAEIQEQMQKKFAEEQGVNLRRDEAGNLLVDIPSPRGWVPADENGEAGTAPPSYSLTLEPAPTGLDRWRPIIGAALSLYFLLLAWSALYLALLAGAQAKAAERREGEFRRAAKAAELRSLRYQVNPHFLFNTLNSLSSLVMTGRTDDAEEMIQTISDFYRHSLADDPTMDVPLEDEFALQRRYLDVEAVRFPKRLRTKFELPEELAGMKVPGMILQPLVENSVKYAVARTSEPVTIHVAAREEFDRLVVTVSNDGGHREKAQQSDGVSGFGIGLANVRDRLAARFGNSASITSGPTLDGYETELRMPLVRHG